MVVKASEPLHKRTTGAGAPASSFSLAIQALA